MFISVDQKLWETSLALLLVAFGLCRSFATYFRGTPVEEGSKAMAQAAR